MMASLIRRPSLRRKSQKRKRTAFTKEVEIHDVIRKGDMKDLNRVFCCNRVSSRQKGAHVLKSFFSSSSGNPQSPPSSITGNEDDSGCISCDVNQEMLGGRSPLHLAVDAERLNVVQFLVEHGATVDHEDNSGWTPLHRAISAGLMEIVKYLLSHDADPCKRMPDGSLPLTVALDRRDIPLVSALISSHKSSDVISGHMTSTQDDSMTQRHVGQTPEMSGSGASFKGQTTAATAQSRSGSGGSSSLRRSASFTSRKLPVRNGKSSDTVTAQQLIAQYTEHQKSKQKITLDKGGSAPAIVNPENKTSPSEPKQKIASLGSRRGPVKVWRMRTGPSSVSGVEDNGEPSPATVTADRLSQTVLSPSVMLTAPSFDDGFAEAMDTVGTALGSKRSSQLSSDSSTSSSGGGGNASVVIDYFQRGGQRGSSFRRAFTSLTRRSRSPTPSPCNSPNRDSELH